MIEPVIIAQVVKSVVDSLVIPAVKETAHFLKIKFNSNAHPLRKHFEDYYERTYRKLSVMNTLAFKNQQLLLKSVYQPLTIIAGDSDCPPVRIDKFPVEAMDQYRRILITDTAGMGKSTLTKFLFIDAVDNGHGIPFFIELRKLKKKYGILDEIIHELGGLEEDFNRDFLLELFRRGDFIFIFDGFDEVGLSNRDAVVEDLKNFIGCMGANRFILTSRQETMLTAFGDFRNFSIVPLKENEAYQLLSRYDDSGELSENLIKEIRTRKDSSIKEFMKNPLLVTLLFIVYNHKAQIPLKKHLFYQQVYEALFESHDLTKGGSMVHEKKCGLDIDDFEKILRRIGFMSFKNGKLEFTRDELIDYISEAGEFWSSLNFKPSGYLDDLVSAVPLFCKEGLYYRWTHKSLSEYFAAKFIFYDLGSRQQEQLKRMIGSDEVEKYINLLDLYQDMDPSGFDEAVMLPLLEEYGSYLERLDSDSPDYFLRNLMFLKNYQIRLMDTGKLGESIDDLISDSHNSLSFFPNCAGNVSLIIRDVSHKQQLGKMLILCMLESKKRMFVKMYKPSSFRYSWISTLQHDRWIGAEELIGAADGNLDRIGELCDIVAAVGKTGRVYITQEDIELEKNRIRRDIRIKNSDILI
ncbi:NACHT domain-containing NTPase [uncultured Muribaculum sp.]|uniref:NACHT domain-containing protein n=1 Tax=uncultured Muribaculum sp. TaxID=1918613 RepID=UPI002731D83D|nr:NACHT domain-containing protein [uncultured Muribaculum sp.]